MILDIALRAFSLVSGHAQDPVHKAKRLGAMEKLQVWEEEASLKECWGPGDRDVRLGGLKL